MSLKSIGMGWGRWLKLLPVSQVVKNESERRLLVCEVCPKSKHSKFLEVIGDGMENVNGMYCTECSCPCHQKSLTDDKCPLGKWEIK